jgi:hypothetical protein
LCSRILFIAIQINCPADHGERITKNKARNKERRDSQLTNTFHEKKNSEAKFQKVELR